MHILALLETDVILDSEVNIDNYHLFRLNRKSRHGGGICIYIHHSLQVQLLPFTNANLEMLCLKFWFRKTVYIIVCLYCPPNTPAQFWFNLDSTLEGLEGQDIILLGDLNINLLNKD